MQTRCVKYRMYPTRAQETVLLQTLETCRHLYNRLLEQREAAYDANSKSLSCFEQQRYISSWKKDSPYLPQVHSQVLQNVAIRVDLAFKAYFRRVKAGGEKPGYPRFKGKGRYDSITYPQWPSGCKLSGERLTLSKIGSIKVKQRRPLEGMPKTCTVRRASTGKWFVTIACEIEPKPLPESNERVGIDVGLTSFATFSDGEKIENPRFFRLEEKALAKEQRRMAKHEKGTPERAKYRKRVSHIHERVSNKRHNFIHQESRKIVNRFQVISVEDLSVNRMVHNHCLAKSIQDAAWSGFADCLAYKAAYAGRQYVAINPAYTSQDCSRCGHRKKKTLSECTHSCPCCNLVLDRDHNAALNVLALGLQSLGLTQEAPGFIRGE